MKRRLFNLLTGLSLLLCLATATVWVRSYWIAETIVWSDTHGSIDGCLISASYGGVGIGRVHVERAEDIGESDPGHHFFHRKDPATEYPYLAGLARRVLSPTPVTSLRFYGFEFVYARDNRGIVLHGMVVPLPAICVPALVLPVLWLRLKCRRRRRLKGNLCLICGYDLRATPDRCPECGTVPGKAGAS